MAKAGASPGTVNNPTGRNGQRTTNPDNPARWLFAVLCYLRLQRGLSQRNLGYMVGKPRTYISKCERGEMDIGIQSLEQLADALQVAVPTILKMCEIIDNDAEEAA